MTAKTYDIDVVVMAAMVPLGIAVGASAKSPDLFDPAIIPVTDGKKMPIIIIADDVKSAATQLKVVVSVSALKLPSLFDFLLSLSLHG